MTEVLMKSHKCPEEDQHETAAGVTHPRTVEGPAAVRPRTLRKEPTLPRWTPAYGREGVDCCGLGTHVRGAA